MQSSKQSFRVKVEMLNALANSTRLCIVYGLYKNGIRSVGEIQECTGVPQSSVSQHLAKLKAAGIVQCERNANEVHYQLADKEVYSLIQLLFPE